MLAPPDASANDGQQSSPIAEIKITQIRGSMSREAILRTIRGERSSLETTLSVIRNRPAVVSVRIMILASGRGHPVSATVRPEGSNTPFTGMIQMMLLSAIAPMRFPTTSAGLTLVDVEFVLSDG